MLLVSVVLYDVSMKKDFHAPVPQPNQYNVNCQPNENRSGIFSMYSFLLFCFFFCFIYLFGMAYEHTWRAFSFDTYSYLFDEDNERRHSIKEQQQKILYSMPNNKILSLRPIQFVSAGVLRIFNADVYTAMSALLSCMCVAFRCLKKL